MQAEAIAEIEPADRPAAASVTGYVDAVSGSRIFGWAWDPQRPTARIAIRVMTKGDDIAALIANQPREDLAANGVGDGAHAFEVAIADGVSPGDVQVLAVCPDSGDTIELARAPVPMRSQRALHGNLQAAVAAIDGLRKAKAEPALEDGADKDDRSANEALLAERIETLEAALLRIDRILAEHGALLPALQRRGVDRVSRVLAGSAVFLAAAAMFIAMLR